MASVIAAISTPMAPAGLGVIRLSGAGAIEIASTVFKPLDKTRQLTALAGYRAAYGRVSDEQGDIDECIATVFRAPHSYTGEDVVEFSCHGGLYLLQRTLRALFAAGAKPAEAGEFTRRAFVNGKLDLTGAESVMTLIEANGRLAAKTALSVREGVLFRRLTTVKESLIALQAQFSAFVDYPDDDIPELGREALETELILAKEQLTKLLSTYDAGRVLREGIDTAIVGSPNVGKSTVMNLLSGCERSIVTPIAGTTRDVVEEVVRVGEVCLRLSDTAGIRETDDTVEALGVERSRRRLESAALILAVFDASRALSADDLALIEQLPVQGTIALINKQDLDKQIDDTPIKEKFPYSVELQAANGVGLEQLTAAIHAVTGVDRLNDAEPVLATERQRYCVCHAVDGVEEALTALQNGMTLDAVSVSVDGAISAVLELTGERATDAVVDGIFARFCVGK